MQRISWFNKAKRAQTVHDDETWIEGGPVPTLNAFDTGDIRATTIVCYSIREDAKAGNFSATEITTARALQALQPSVQSHHAQTFAVHSEPTYSIRRLTPLEAERLQGFPDGWTDGQSDMQRYKQMGNAVTVNVIEWIGSRL